MKLGVLALGWMLATPAESPLLPPADSRHWLADQRLYELSGLAPSHYADRRLWAINDGGLGAKLIALDVNGTIIGSFDLDGVENEDWEDLDAFVWHRRPYLAIGEIGDNDAVRPERAIHIVREPRTLAFDGRLRPEWTIRYRYADGPRDAEGIAVDERSGRILILSKREWPPKLYTLPLEPVGDVQIARPVAELRAIAPPPEGAEVERQPFLRSANQPTAITLDCGRDQLWVLTYTRIYRFDRRDDEWARLDGRRAEVTILNPPLPQAESMSFDRRCRYLYVGSEKPPAPLLRYRLR